MKYERQIPEIPPCPQEIAKQMRINADCIMKQITDHINEELKRFKEEKDKL